MRHAVRPRRRRNGLRPGTAEVPVCRRCCSWSRTSRTAVGCHGATPGSAPTCSSTSRSGPCAQARFSARSRTGFRSTWGAAVFAGALSRQHGAPARPVALGRDPRRPAATKPPWPNLAPLGEQLPSLPSIPARFWRSAGSRICFLLLLPIPDGPHKLAHIGPTDSPAPASPLAARPWARFRVPPTGPAADFRQHQQAQDRAPRRPQRQPRPRVRHLLQQFPQRLQPRPLPAQLRLLRRPLRPHVPPQWIQQHRLRLPRLVRGAPVGAPGAPAAPRLQPMHRLAHGASAAARIPECLGQLQGVPPSVCPAALSRRRWAPSPDEPRCAHPAPASSTRHWVSCAVRCSRWNGSSRGQLSHLSHGWHGSTPVGQPLSAPRDPGAQAAPLRTAGSRDRAARPADGPPPAARAVARGAPAPRAPRGSPPRAQRAALRVPALLLISNRGKKPAPAPNFWTACLACFLYSKEKGSAAGWQLGSDALHYPSRPWPFEGDAVGEVCWIGRLV